MAITFGKQINIEAIYRGTSSGTVHTLLTSTYAPYTATSVAGDYLLFTQSNVNGGKYARLVFNVATAAVGTVTGVWEYCQYNGSITAPVWVALSNVVDPTNGFTTAGANLTVTFDRPDAEWSNRMNPGNNTASYKWNIRFRITSISGMSNYGSVTSTQSWHPNYMLSASATHTFDDIYQDDLANGRGYVTKNGTNQYYFNTTLHSDTSCTLVTKNDYVYFGRNHHMVNYAVLLAGEIDATTGLTKNGSTIVWEVYKGDKNSCFFGWTNSQVYDSTFGCILLGAAGESQGFWGGGFGSVSPQTMKDCRLFGARNYAFQLAANIFRGIKCTEGHNEPSGSTLIETEFGNSQYATRNNNTGSTFYLHRPDISKMGANTSNPYQVSNANWVENWVDAKYKNGQDFAAFAKWNSPVSVMGSFMNARVFFVSSVELQVVNEKDIGLSNVTCRVTFPSGVSTYSSNADGYVMESSGTVVTNASNSTSLFYFSGFNASTYRFKEVVMTSGALKGQRSVIHAGATDNITLAEPFTGIPAAGDNFVVIPYIPFGYNKPDPTQLVNQSRNGLYTYQGPFTFEICKPGYETLVIKHDLKTPFKNKIVLTKLNVNVDQEGNL